MFVRQVQPKKKLIALLLQFAFIAPFVFGVALLYGSVDLNWGAGALVDLFLPDSVQHTIFFEIRLPRVLSAFLVGGLLSMAGLIMQALLKNPLADPYILGVSAGAGLGGILVSMLIPSAALFWAQPVGAAIGAFIVIMLVFALLVTRETLAAERFILVGVAVSSLCTAMISLLLVMSEANSFRGFMFWLLGELNGENWSLLLVVWALVLGCLLPLAKAMNGFMFGDDLAYAAGVNVPILKWQLYWLAAMATSFAVSAGGMIGFVGLVIPHAMRLLFGTDHRILVPACALFGGLFLVISDVLSRVLIAPEQLPIGVITALIGAPIFIFLLVKNVQMSSQQRI